MDFQSEWFSFSISTVAIVFLIVALVRPDLLADLIAALKNLWKRS